MQYIVRRFFEVAGDGFAFSYTPGRIVTGERLNLERLTRDLDGQGAYLEVFGGESMEKKAAIAEADKAQKRGRGRPPKQNKAVAI